MSSSRPISPRAALREQILRETLTLRADLRADEGQVDSLTAYRKEMEKEEMKHNGLEASSSSGFRGFFKKRLSSIATLHSSITTSIADEVATATADSSDSLAQIPTHICSSSRRRSSLFSQDSRRSSISDGINNCSTYRASRRRSSLFAYDDLVQEKSGTDESSNTASNETNNSTDKTAGTRSNNSRRQSFSTIEFFASLGLEEEEINGDSSSTSSEGRKSSFDDADHQASYAALSSSISNLNSKEFRPHGPRAA